LTAYQSNMGAVCEREQEPVGFEATSATASVEVTEPDPVEASATVCIEVIVEFPTGSVGQGKVPLWKLEAQQREQEAEVEAAKFAEEVRARAAAQEAEAAAAAADASANEAETKAKAKSKAKAKAKTKAKAKAKAMAQSKAEAGSAEEPAPLPAPAGASPAQAKTKAKAKAQSKADACSAEEPAPLPAPEETSPAKAKTKAKAKAKSKAEVGFVDVPTVLLVPAEASPAKANADAPKKRITKAKATEALNKAMEIFGLPKNREKLMDTVNSAQGDDMEKTAALMPVVQDMLKDLMVRYGFKEEKMMLTVVTDNKGEANLKLKLVQVSGDAEKQLGRLQSSLEQKHQEPIVQNPKAEVYQKKEALDKAMEILGLPKNKEKIMDMVNSTQGDDMKKTAALMPMVQDMLEDLMARYGIKEEKIMLAVVSNDEGTTSLKLKLVQVSGDADKQLALLQSALEGNHQKSIVQKPKAKVYQKPIVQKPKQTTMGNR